MVPWSIFFSPFFFFFLTLRLPCDLQWPPSSGCAINHGIGKGWSSRLAVIESRSHTPLRRGLAVTLWPPSRGSPYRRDYRSTIGSQEGRDALLSSSQSGPDKLSIPFRYCLPISCVANRITTQLHQIWVAEEKRLPAEFDNVQEGRKGVGLENDIVQKLIEVPNQSIAQSYKLKFYHFCEPFCPRWSFLCDYWLNWPNQHWGRISR